MRDTQREAETQAEGEAGSMQGARWGTRSQVPRITPWAEGSAKLLSQQACPLLTFSMAFISGPSMQLSIRVLRMHSTLRKGMY